MIHYDQEARIEAIEERIANAEGFIYQLLSKGKPPFPINDPPHCPLGPWSISDRMPKNEWMKRFIEGGLRKAREDLAS